MAGFTSRIATSDKMSSSVTDFLKEIGFTIQPMGYENFFDKSLMQILRRIHNDPTVSYARYIPDNFAYFNDKKIFWLEYKVCDAPIIYDSRVKTLQGLSGDTTLSKDNIGAIEQAAMQVYKGLSSLGIKILIIIYSSFHKRGGTSIPFVCSFVDQINIKHQDNVTVGMGNASWTPYANVNLDEFEKLDDFMKGYTGIDPAKVDAAFSKLKTAMGGTS